MQETRKIGASEVDAALESEQLDNVARYAAGGRRFGQTPADQLSDQYLTRFKEVFAGAAPHPEAIKDFEDLGSEFSLRGIDAPTPPPAVMELARAKLQAVGKQVTDSPEASDLMARALASRLTGTGGRN